MLHLRTWITIAGLYLCFGGAGRPAHAQPGNADLDVVRVRPNLYMIAGAGGNIAVQTGDDGAVLVDSGAGEASDRVIAAVKRITARPIRYIINTGADADHVGGNGKVAKAGRSIFAMGPDPVGGEFAKVMTNGYAASILAAVLAAVPCARAREKWPQMPEEEKQRQDAWKQHEQELVASIRPFS